MKQLKLQIIPIALLAEYKSKVSKTLPVNFEQLTDSSLSADTFSFYTSVSAVFSSKIEGEEIELDSFMKHKMMGVKFLPDYTQKIDDLYEAYLFAQKTNLDVKFVKKAHALLTQHILQKAQRGKITTGNMFVLTPNGKIEYIACTPDKVKPELNKLFKDISALIHTDLTIEETFFFASMIHLLFVKIHPFGDGNGRTARLIEKWFLAQKLAEQAWYIRSEQHYYNYHDTYYANIRQLGLEYDLLNYAGAMPFLLMLADAVDIER